MNDILFGNNNSKVITKLSKRYFKKNKVRNLAALLAIILTAFLFTSITSLAFNMASSIKRFSLSNKKPRDYLLRGKVFCGCCDHAMSLRNGAWFYCRHSEVAETLPCHGVRIKMADLEQVVFETIRAQMCPALGIDSNKDKLDLQTVQQAEHEEKLRSIQDSKRHLYEQYALGEIDLETYRTRKAVYDTELVQAKNVHAVITAQTKQIKSDYEIKLKQQEIVQEVGNANMLTKALIDRLINKVYVFPGDRIEIEYATQDFLETKESEKEV